MRDFIGILIVFGGLYFIYTNYWGVESGCKEYSSRYSCAYLKEKAQYQVYYWKNVEAGDPSDEVYITTTNGLKDSRNFRIKVLERQA